jgi:hypothetical protein
MKPTTQQTVRLESPIVSLSSRGEIEMVPHFNTGTSGPACRSDGECRE